MKTCTGCGQTGPLEGFSRDRTKADGRATRCKVCRALANADHYRENAERIKARTREYWSATRAERQRAAEEWARRNPDKMAEYRRRWRHDNRLVERTAASVRQKQLAQSGHYRLNRAISRGVWGVLKGRKAGRRWCEVVGYSAPELRAHLEARFVEGMSWENYGAGWHVDHIRPKTRFDFATHGLKAIRECWALANLQPLWATDNLRKNRW